MRNILLCILLLFGISGSAIAANGDTLQVNKDIRLIEIGDSIFVHETFDESPGFGRFSSNGLVVVRNGKALMVDTPMDNHKTKIIADYLEVNYSARVSVLIVGHYHDDCLGGINYLHDNGVVSYSSGKTVGKCVELGLTVPMIHYDEKELIDFEGVAVECYYLGGGHTLDNSVVWFPELRILFGGCLVKSLSSRGLGNISDAVIDQWPNTIKVIADKFNSAEVVIPGHGPIGDQRLLDHTLLLLNKR